MDMLSEYNYELPEGLIARRPAEPRDSSRLFVYDTKSDRVVFDVFGNIHEYLPRNSFLVFNNTKVLPARVILNKEKDESTGRGGGKAEILFLVNELCAGDNSVKGLSDRKLTVGQKLYFPDGHSLTVSDQKEKFFFFKPDFGMDELVGLLFKYGITPVPKYIGDPGMSEEELREKYQSVFAKNPASVAAPTASLHFTEEVLNNIKRSGVPSAFVTLNVGLGTFAPISDENFKARKLHEEFFEITPPEADKIRRYKEEGRALFAVGTTAVRALESSCAQNIEGEKKKTDIFIYPPYDFKMVDGLVTNFHLPKSSLMCLVDAFLKFKGAKRSLVDLYKIAIAEKFRFYSFGDAMLII